VHHRPLALVSVLAGGDYLLWNWSLQGSHDVLALMSGLTLTPLAIALLWLLALNAARLLSRIAPRVRTARTGVAAPHANAAASAEGVTATTVATATGAATGVEDERPGGEQVSSSSKLAA
jgi:hypothetical protein